VQRESGSCSWDQTAAVCAPLVALGSQTAARDATDSPVASEGIQTPSSAAGQDVTTSAISCI